MNVRKVIFGGLMFMVGVFGIAGIAIACVHQPPGGGCYNGYNCPPPTTTTTTHPTWPTTTTTQPVVTTTTQPAPTTTVPVTTPTTVPFKTNVTPAPVVVPPAAPVNKPTMVTAGSAPNQVNFTG